MDNKLILFLTVLVCGLYGDVDAKPEVISITMTPLAVPGDTVVYECRVANLPYGKLLYTFKQVNRETGEPLIELVATNDVLTPMYESMYTTFPKFSVTLELQSNIVVVTMIITGVSVEDTGYYGCRPQDGEMQQRKLEVYAAPRSIDVVNEPSGEFVVFEDGKPRNIMFEVNHTCPVPDLSFDVAGYDKTSCLMTSDQVNVLCEGSIGTKQCPIYMDYNVTSECRGLIMTKDKDKEQLIFTATYPYPEINETIILNRTISVYYKPTIDCENLVVHTKEGGQVDFSCQVDCNPPPGKVVWQFTTSDGTFHEIDPSVNDQIYRMKQESVDDRKFLVGLSINDVKDIHFVQYKLKIEHHTGDWEQTFELTEAKLTTTVPPEAGAPALLQGFNRLMLVLFALGTILI